MNIFEKRFVDIACPHAGSSEQTIKSMSSISRLRFQQILHARNIANCFGKQSR
ncbi:hypothetical protein BRPE64_ECDS00930 (plasmid) [Caballeronia insecticola]|uniref:Uncharacterized protein n=1 Tax=Caballeronia insecticola TaxID=758793 RepID=R4X4I3_9BURK|nr:hypothetical protein BRPE64_ECDS00930 [Caballeronia insecticola]